MGSHLVNSGGLNGARSLRCDTDAAACRLPILGLGRLRERISGPLALHASTGQSPAPGPGHARIERGRRPAAPHGPARPAPAGRGRSPTRQRERHASSLHTGPPLRRVTEPARALGMPVLATARQAQRERQPSGKQTTSSPRMIPPEYGPDTIKRETGTTSSEARGSDNAHGQVFSTGCWTMTTPT
jgi:hypothetical protein